MNVIAAMTRLERLIIPRAQAERELAEMLDLGVYVALLAPVRCGRSTVLRGLKSWFELERPDGLFVLLRPDQSPDLKKDVFLADLLSKLAFQLQSRRLPPPRNDGDPYLTLKSTLSQLPSQVKGPVVVAIDDLGRVDVRLLHSLLWIFRELHSQRADEGWNGPLSRLAVIVAGSRRLFELTFGQEDHTVSPFNVAELYHLPDFSRQESEEVVRRAQLEGLLTLHQDVETMATLRRFSDGHPALLKELLAEVVHQGGRLTPQSVQNAASQALQHDRTLFTLWERLLGEPAALEVAHQLFMEGATPPANLELATDAVRTLYWFGLITEHNGVYVPRCQLVDAFMRSRLEALAQQPAIPVRTSGAQPTITQDPLRISGGHPSITADPLRTSGGQPQLPPTQLTQPQLAQDNVRNSGTHPPVQPNATANGQPEPLNHAPNFPDMLFPEGLLRAFRQREAVLFVGAGTSRAAGMPTWAELSAQMQVRLLQAARNNRERQDLHAYLQGNDALAVAQLFQDRVGLYEYHRFLTDSLRKPVKLAAVHLALRKLPVKLVLTTNYDKMLERTFRGEEDTEPRVLFSTAQLGSLQEHQDMTVVKMHGDIDHPESIVLTSDDYRSYFEHRKALRDFLEYQFSYRTVFFVGFSLKDPNFDLIYEEARRALQQRNRPAYALMVGNNPIESAQWGSRGMQIIDLQDYVEVPAYLDALVARITSPG